MNDIISRVREINPEAADFLQGQKDTQNPEYGWRDGIELDGVMVWDDTPQKHKYWESIAEQLGGHYE